MKKLVILFLLPFIFFACDKDETSEPLNDDTIEAMELKSKKSKLELELEGLSWLGPHYRYEGWIIVNGEPITTGKFNITPDGTMAPSVFPVNGDDLAAATTFVLTIEPQPDHDPAPAETHVLAGDFSGDDATLTISHSAALGTDFSSADGTFILATPTNGPGTDELSGIWFLDLSAGPPPTAGLDLPALPDGWVYEGWTVINGMPVTSGKFEEVDDFDWADPYSSDMYPGPPFPGEDYLMNAPYGLTFPTDLSGGTGVISVEPYPDYSDAPFAIKPLVGGIPDPATDHQNYPMSLNPGSFPTGTASR